MRVCEWLKENNFKYKHIHFAIAMRDKENDDFHILPSPVITFNRLELLAMIGVGIKWGFWGLGVGFAYARKDVHIYKKDDLTTASS